MGKFKDKWVVDKSLFDFFKLGGGSCACCQFMDAYNQDLKGMINAISDLETDAADAELNAAQKSPWPHDMRDKVWGDRLRLRMKMKNDMPFFKDFFSDGYNINEHLEHDVISTNIMTNTRQKHVRPIVIKELEKWCHEELGPVGLRKIFQMPRSEIIDIVISKYNIMKHGAFGIVLSVVVDQVANFQKTKYPTDGRASEEIEFEKQLTFDRRAGFVLPVTATLCQSIDANMNNNIIICDDVLRMFFDRMETLGGPSLLARAPKKVKSNYDSEEEDQSFEENDTNSNNGPSFRLDRRVVRLIIARYWATRLIQKFNKYRGHSN